MNTLEALQARKSIRGYLDKPVEAGKLKTILKYGNKAPNAGPIHMSVIQNANLLKEINDVATEAGLKSDNDFLKQRLAIPGYKLLYGAPVLIVLSAPDGEFSAANTACAATNMCIAATELELGTCYLAGFLLAFTAKPELLQKIGIPEGFKPRCGMIIGYEGPNQIPGMEWIEDYSNINYVD